MPDQPIAATATVLSPRQTLRAQVSAVAPGLSNEQFEALKDIFWDWACEQRG